MPRNLVFLGAYFPLSKCEFTSPNSHFISNRLLILGYANAMLATLNARETLRKTSSARPPAVVATSSMVFYRPYSGHVSPSTDVTSSDHQTFSLGSLRNPGLNGDGDVPSPSQEKVSLLPSPLRSRRGILTCIYQIMSANHELA
jgi:hypothetical protein